MQRIIAACAIFVPRRAAQRLREFARVRRMATSAALGVVINGYLDSLERDGEPRGPASRGN